MPGTTQGSMQGDFSRVTFDPAHHFSAVLSQQGRVQLDADTNEQTAILLHYLRTLATDLIGPAGCPRDPDGGFEITPLPAEGRPVTDLGVLPGRLYVDGILVENDTETTYWEQSDGYLVADDERDRLPEDGSYLVYLRVWERLVTSVQDMRIREVALGDYGPDTCARSRVVWQLAVLEESQDDRDVRFPDTEDPATWLEWLRKRLVRDWQRTPRLAAFAKRPDDADNDVCDVDPESRYRGPENQLYRVEVHHGGKAGTATFKWSRENASVILPIEEVADDTITLASTGRDGKLGLEVGDMVEVVDDAYACRVADDIPPMAEPDPLPRLYQIKEIDYVARVVTLDDFSTEHCGGAGSNPDRHPFLRRWDHELTDSEDGAILIEEDEQEFVLEDGVTVVFVPPPEPEHNGEQRDADNGADDSEESLVYYRRGDYWLIPARVVTGDVDWPQEYGQPKPLPPNGVAYHYAPLALVDAGQGSVVQLLPRFDPLTATTVQLQAATAESEAKQPAAEETRPTTETGPAKKQAAKKQPAKKSTAKKATGGSSG